MGGSRRRRDKTRKKVSIRPKKKPITSSLLPQELQCGSKAIHQKLGSRASWDSQQRLQSNYEANGLLADCNAHFGRNAASASDPMKEKTANFRSDGEGSCDSDDDLRQVEGKPRRDGKRAELIKPTTHQQLIVKRLIAEHGSDIEGMVKDRKLNSMLLPASKLRKLIEGYSVYGEKGRCRFRVPVKHL